MNLGKCRDLLMGKKGIEEISWSFLISSVIKASEMFASPSLVSMRFIKIPIKDHSITESRSESRKKKRKGMLPTFHKMWKCWEASFSKWSEMTEILPPFLFNTVGGTARETAVTIERSCRKASHKLHWERGKGREMCNKRGDDPFLPFPSHTFFYQTVWRSEGPCQCITVTFTLKLFTFITIIIITSNSLNFVLLLENFYKTLKICDNNWYYFISSLLL